MLICSMVNNIDKIDCFTNGDGDRSNGFETILRYYGVFRPLQFLNPQAINRPRSYFLEFELDQGVLDLGPALNPKLYQNGK